MKQEIRAKQIYCGQNESYGDFFRLWEVETNLPKEEVLSYCFTNLSRKQLPEHTEWLNEIRYGTGKHWNDAGYYFAGWYKLEKNKDGYKFTVCEPFAD